MPNEGRTHHNHPLEAMRAAGIRPETAVRALAAIQRAGFLVVARESVGDASRAVESARAALARAEQVERTLVALSDQPLLVVCGTWRRGGSHRGESVTVCDACTMTADERPGSPHIVPVEYLPEGWPDRIERCGAKEKRHRYDSREDVLYEHECRLPANHTGRSAHERTPDHRWVEVWG